jgi:hypothetical protein
MFEQSDAKDLGLNKTEDLFLEVRQCRTSKNKIPGFTQFVILIPI